MFSSFVLPAHDPLAGLLSNGNAAQLQALAGYFEAQAARLRGAADELKRKERAAIGARDRRKAAKENWIKTGARAHVLRVRGLEWPTVSARLGCTHEQARAACGEWRRKKVERARARRDLAIFKLVCADVERGEIAKRYGITARQVRTIAARLSSELSRR